jgi:starch phosphorylase
MTAPEVADKVREQFAGRHAIETSPRLKAALGSLETGAFSADDPGRYHPIVGALRDYDRYMVAADFDAYWDAQRAVDHLWRTPADWWRMSILNTAGMAWFSSDRTIREYARDIWHLPAG